MDIVHGTYCGVICMNVRVSEKLQLVRTRRMPSKRNYTGTCEKWLTVFARTDEEFLCQSCSFFLPRNARYGLLNTVDDWFEIDSVDVTSLGTSRKLKDSTFRLENSLVSPAKPVRTMVVLLDSKITTLQAWNARWTSTARKSWLVFQTSCQTMKCSFASLQNIPNWSYVSMNKKFSRDSDLF